MQSINDGSVDAKDGQRMASPLHSPDESGTDNIGKSGNVVQPGSTLTVGTMANSEPGYPPRFTGDPSASFVHDSGTPKQVASQANCVSSSQTKKIMSMALLAMPLALGVFLYFTNPFRDELVREVYSLSCLSPNQQYNIELATRALDGRVLKPGELFSFNRAVGPRRDRRGYRPAPTYVGPESPATVGGGICLVSSALYQAALATGLKIEARTPHLRTIASVTPGLDATVWYGRKDLKFRNCTPEPIQIKAECKDHNLYISILGERRQDLPALAQLKTVVARRNKNELMVEVFREVKGNRSFISRDHYQINK